MQARLSREPGREDAAPLSGLVPSEQSLGLRPLAPPAALSRGAMSDGLIRPPNPSSFARGSSDPTVTSARDLSPSAAAPVPSNAPATPPANISNAPATPPGNYEQRSASLDSEDTNAYLMDLGAIEMSPALSACSEPMPPIRPMGFALQPDITALRRNLEERPSNDLSELSLTSEPPPNIRGPSSPNVRSKLGILRSNSGGGRGGTSSSFRQKCVTIRNRFSPRKGETLTSPFGVEGGPVAPGSPHRSSSPTPRSFARNDSQGKFFVPGTPDFRRRKNSWAGRLGDHVGLHHAVPSHRPDGERLRLLRRDAPFRQSTGRIYMHRTGAAVGLALHDLFHVALSMPWILLMILCTSSYTIVMLIFACLFCLADGPEIQCGIAPYGRRPTFYHAFAFSMETLTTIGYGIPHDGNFFEEQCAQVLVLVYFEALIFIILNASIVGVLFARVASAQKRASQIIFSDKAVIRCVRNRFYFMLQVGEASFFTYHPVVEAHVRVYAVLHEEARTQGRGSLHRDALPDRAFFQTRVMRLTNPNDELGGMMFLATPQIVSHRIDQWSPMFPPAARVMPTDSDEHDGNAYHFPGLVFREADREVATSDDWLHIDSAAAEASVHNGSDYLRTDQQTLGLEGASRMSAMRRNASKESLAHLAGAAGELRRSDPDPSKRASIQRTGSQPLPRLPPMGSTPDGPVEQETTEPIKRSPVVRRRTGLKEAMVAGGGGHSHKHGRSSSHRRSDNDATSMPATGNSATTQQLLEMRKLIKQHITRSHLEAVIIVEAIDPHSSNPFQARHSYCAEDIVFDHSFEPCMRVASDGQARLDWDLFNKTKESPFNTAQIIGGAHS